MVELLDSRCFLTAYLSNKEGHLSCIKMNSIYALKWTKPYKNILFSNSQNDIMGIYYNQKMNDQKVSFYYVSNNNKWSPQKTLHSKEWSAFFLENCISHIEPLQCIWVVMLVPQDNIYKSAKRVTVDFLLEGPPNSPLDQYHHILLCVLTPRKRYNEMSLGMLK